MSSLGTKIHSDRVLRDSFILDLHDKFYVLSTGLVTSRIPRLKIGRLPF